MGVGHGEQALVSDENKSPKAVRAVLWHLLTHFASGDFAGAGIAQCTLWCDCGQYFEIRKLSNPKNVPRNGTFRFAAFCAEEGVIQFFWVNQSIRTCDTRAHRVTSIVFSREEPKR